MNNRIETTIKLNGGVEDLSAIEIIIMYMGS